ncbi:MAG TPA: hypothetical protein VGN42_13600 [Pirellulales bacterium]|nr:hypothetical protein [Pirellulales bacterium]
MTRTHVLFAIFLVAVGRAIAAPHAAAQTLHKAPPASRSDDGSAGDLDAGAQPPSDALPLDAAQEQYQKAEQRAIDVAIGFLKKHQQSASDAPANDRQTLRDKLRPVVEESFDARQRLQQAELKDLRRRLAEIEQAIEAREKNKDVIVNSRVDALLQGPAKSDSLPLSGSSESPVTAPPGGPPPGTVARVRYVQETVEENGRQIPIVRGITEYVKIQGATVPQPEDAGDEPSAAPRRTTSDASTGEARGPASAVGEFDLDTRERLARLDVQTAEAESEAATADVRLLQQMFEQGAASQSALADRKKEQRQAEYQFKRAKLKLEGLAGQRAEFEAAAEAAVAEARAEVEREGAKVRVAEANATAAMAQKQQREADVGAAAASHEFQQKKYDRMRKLATVEKAVDFRVVDNEQEKLLVAEATLVGAKSAVATAEANVTQAKSAVEEAQAAMNVAKLRLQAAEVRPNRLSRSNKAVDLKQSNPSEAKILAALSEQTELAFVDQPLTDVVEYLKERHQIEIQLDSRALQNERIGADTPVNFNISGTTLRSALQLMLRKLDLAFVINNEVLLITTENEAKNMASGETHSGRPPAAGKSESQLPGSGQSQPSVKATK